MWCVYLSLLADDVILCLSFFHWIVGCFSLWSTVYLHCKTASSPRKTCRSWGGSTILVLSGDNNMKRNSRPILPHQCDTQQKDSMIQRPEYYFAIGFWTTSLLQPTLEGAFWLKCATIYCYLLLLKLLHKLLAWIWQNEQYQQQQPQQCQKLAIWLTLTKSECGLVDTKLKRK